MPHPPPPSSYRYPPLSRYHHPPQSCSSSSPYYDSFTPNSYFPSDRAVSRSMSRSISRSISRSRSRSPYRFNNNSPYSSRRSPQHYSARYSYHPQHSPAVHNRSDRFNRRPRYTREVARVDPPPQEGLLKSHNPAPPIKEPEVAVSTTPDQYETLAQVGEGTYGKVFRARNRRTGTLVALKRIRIETSRDGFPITAIRELQLLQRVQTTNVVKLLDIALESTTDSEPACPVYVYMVFEYMQHDLAGILHHPKVRFTGAHVKSLVQQLLLGLAFLHSRGIIHRDVKGSNLLLNQAGQLKLADFGLARSIGMRQQNESQHRALDLTNRVITLWYRPLELLLGSTHYGGEVDVWSVGCILLELILGRPLFPGADELSQIDVIMDCCGTPCNEEWPELDTLPWWPLIRPHAKLPRKLIQVHEQSVLEAFSSDAEQTESNRVAMLLIDLLLQITPSRRPSARLALQHSWFTTAPLPELPKVLGMLDESDHWHEFESKQRKRAQRALSRNMFGSDTLASPQYSSTETHLVTSVRVLPAFGSSSPPSVESPVAVRTTKSSRPTSAGPAALSVPTSHRLILNKRKEYAPSMPLIQLALQPRSALVAPPVQPKCPSLLPAVTQTTTPSSPGTHASNSQELASH